VDYQTEVQSDADGRFEMPRVPAGKVYISPRNSICRPLQLVEVRSNVTTSVVLGGQGRPVVGHVLIPPELAARKDWSFTFPIIGPKLDPVPSPMPQQLKQASLREQARWWQDFQGSDASKKYQQAQDALENAAHGATHQFDIQTDGTFRAEDIAAGSYGLDFEVTQNKTPDQPAHKLGDAHCEFTVAAMPGGRSDEALAIPTVEIHTSTPLTIGDAAPDFTVHDFDGRQIKLSDFRGKYVLLEFWATWCGPCVGETDHMKDVFTTFGKNERFAMIGLSLDPQPNDPIQYIAKNGLSWNQGFLGDWDSAPVVKDYDVTGIPSIWLIGPDGKIVKQHLRGEKIMSAIATALRK
jgi:peroxiredoxin